MPRARVSVIVPTFNRAHYLKECLDSILGQTRIPDQVIVIDDGSKDNTGEVVEAFGQCITYLKKPNGGKPSALNQGLPLTTGDYVWIFDDDDVALPDSIERRLAVMEQYPALGFVATGHLIGVDGPDGKIVRQHPYAPPQPAAGEEFLDLLYGCFFTMQSMLMRRSHLIEAGRFDETLFASEDYDMMLRIASRHPFRILAEPSFIFRQHQGARGAQTVRYHASERQKVFMKYDGVAGKKLRQALPLTDYLVPRAQHARMNAGQMRLALLTRMSVMASKGLLREMSEDAVAAASLNAGDAPSRLTEHERSVCRKAACQLYLWMQISEAPTQFLISFAPLKRLPAGRAIAREVAAGLVRYAKSYGFPLRDRFKMLWLASRLSLRT